MEKYRANEKEYGGAKGCSDELHTKRGRLKFMSNSMLTRPRCIGCGIKEQEKEKKREEGM